jgi:hypothetical protein
MKSYTVKLSGSVNITVEAENEDEAMSLAYEELETQDYNINDIIDTFEIIKVEDTETEGDE